MRPLFFFTYEFRGDAARAGRNPTFFGIVPVNEKVYNGGDLEFWKSEISIARLIKEVFTKMSSIQEVIQRIDSALKEEPERAQEITAVYQFNLSGEEEGTYQMVLRPDNAYAEEGEKESPDCTLSMDSEDFKEMVEGDLSGTQAFMSGKLKIDGDMGLAIRLQDVLAAYSAADY